MITVFALAYADQSSVTFNTLILKVMAVIVLIPAIYLFYLVKRYFKFRRAFGMDHFDTAVRNEPFVRHGLFKFTSNAMYVFGFLLLWAPAL